MLKLSNFYKHEESANRTQFCDESSRSSFYFETKIVCNQKELKLLVTILLTIVAILDKKLRKLILVQLHFFPFREKKYKVMLRLVVTFQRFHIYSLVNSLKSKKSW